MTILAPTLLPAASSPSPAPRAASAPASSRPCSRPAGRRPDRPRPGLARRQRPARLILRAQRTLAVAADVTDPASLRRAAEAAVAAFRHARTAGSTTPASSGWGRRTDYRRGLGSRVFGQCARRPPWRAGGAPRLRRQWRIDRQHRLERRKSRLPEYGRLQRDQGGGDQPHPLARARMGGEQHQRQCRLPGQCGDPDAPRCGRSARPRDGKSSGCRSSPAMVPAQLGRHVEPIEIGRVVVFLLSDAARSSAASRSIPTAAIRRTDAAADVARGARTTIGPSNGGGVGAMRMAARTWRPHPAGEEVDGLLHLDRAPDRGAEHRAPRRGRSRA